MHAQAQGIVTLLLRLYEEIRVLEIEFGLCVGPRDFRPRIEYFHDAVRALSAGDAQAREAGGRLSVEFLAYDLSCLRYLQSMPLAPLTPGHRHLSPATGLTTLASQAVAAHAKKPGKMEKQRMSELYRQYGVLFSALFKPVADEDYRDRVEEMQAQAEEIAAVLQQVESLGQGKGSEQSVRASAAHCEDKETRALAEGVLSKQSYKKTNALTSAIKGLKNRLNRADQGIAGLEASHMQYGTAQLALFEAGKDLVKQLAGKGVNLAGQFVQAAQTHGPQGRGR
jgi:hypothetical protein